MRNLKLESPRMTGADVEDWQTFLTLCANYRDVIDGIFGPNTARATRVFQTHAGLPADGVVGPATFSRAVLDGFQSAARTIEAGMDARVDCTRFAAGIAGEGIRFVARYYSRVAAKTLQPAEARALCAAGLKLVTVYQDSQNAVKFFSADQGVTAAERALTLAGTVGQLEDSAIYFAADFDPSPAEVRGPLVEYFQAVSQTFRSAATRYAIGVYGSGLTCRLIRDAGLAQFAWLSCSTGFRESAGFRPRAHLIQVAPSRRICGGKLAIDDNVAQTGEYGAFTV